MRCPFLKDTQVRFCEVSPFRKMILRVPEPEDHEKCTSPDHVRCSAFRGGIVASSEPGRCPFLREALVQYCEAAPVVQFIPYSDALLSRCQSGGYRLCDLYLSRAEPGRGHAGRPGEGSPGSSRAAEKAHPSSPAKEP